MLKSIALVGYYNGYYKVCGLSFYCFLRDEDCQRMNLNCYHQRKGCKPTETAGCAMSTLLVERKVMISSHQIMFQQSLITLLSLLSGKLN